MAESLGARITDEGNTWRVTGGSVASNGKTIDVGNSGTSLYFGIAAAALSGNEVTFDGDAQIRRRSAAPLLKSLADLGVSVSSNNGCAPLAVKGPLKGGHTQLESVTSQYLSALLLAAPLAKKDSVIDVTVLNEKPYVMMTLQWLDRCGIKYEHENFTRFKIRGSQQFKPFDISIPADFSSASFFLAAGAICKGPLTLDGLDYSDIQGDKRVADILREMGAKVDVAHDSITVQGPLLRGGDFDLNEIPDSLPILATAACFAPGKTRLFNVAHARIKETDRIKVMHDELIKVGGSVAEHDDGLTILHSPLEGGVMLGHGDHRVVMSGAIAGCASRSGITIRGSDAAAVTFPEFQNLLRSAGGIIEEI
jgi:3-phosphoshikimate 1-carboxyvinyltransferase